jgi:hypothetical protein
MHNDNDDPDAFPDRPDHSFVEITQELMRAFVQLSDADRRAVIDYAKELLERSR